MSSNFSNNAAVGNNGAYGGAIGHSDYGAVTTMSESCIDSIKNSTFISNSATDCKSSLGGKSLMLSYSV